MRFKGEVVCAYQRGGGLCLSKGRWFVPIKGEVVCAYQRGGGLCLSKRRRWFVPIKAEVTCSYEVVCAYQSKGGDLFV